MSAYGNYKKECPSTFTGGFKVLEEKDVKGHPMGQSLYTAKIPVSVRERKSFLCL